MACCKVCCGCKNCVNGEEGKCCCGGQSGVCCDVGEYCCDGVCQSTPCVDCDTAGSGCQNDGCLQPGCSTDSDCATGWPTPDTQECQDYYAACCGQTCITEYDENNDPISTYCGTLP